MFLEAFRCQHETTQDEWTVVPVVVQIYNTKIIMRSVHTCSAVCLTPSRQFFVSFEFVGHMTFNKFSLVISVHSILKRNEDLHRCFPNFSIPVQDTINCKFSLSCQSTEYGWILTVSGYAVLWKFKDSVVNVCRYVN